MIDELRKDHDPQPHAEERDWIDTDFLGLFSRFVLVAGLAVMIGVSASVLLERAAFTPVVASTSSGGPQR